MLQPRKYECQICPPANILPYSSLDDLTQHQLETHAEINDRYTIVYN